MRQAVGGVVCGEWVCCTDIAVAPMHVPLPGVRRLGFCWGLLLAQQGAHLIWVLGHNVQVLQCVVVACQQTQSGSLLGGSRGRAFVHACTCHEVHGWALHATLPEQPLRGLPLPPNTTGYSACTTLRCAVPLYSPKHAQRTGKEGLCLVLPDQRLQRGPQQRRTAVLACRALVHS